MKAISCCAAHVYLWFTFTLGRKIRRNKTGVKKWMVNVNKQIIRMIRGTVPHHRYKSICLFLLNSRYCPSFFTLFRKCPKGLVPSFNLVIITHVSRRHCFSRGSALQRILFFLGKFFCYIYLTADIAPN